MIGNSSSLQFDLYADEARANELFRTHQLAVRQSIDRIFVWLMPLQWFVSVIIASLFVLPASAGRSHLWTAFWLGGLLTVPPTILAYRYPGATSTRYLIAISQLLVSGLLVYLTGGQSAARFHLYGSLGLLAFYYDWRVLALATLTTTVHHLLKNLFDPMFVYNVLVEGEARWVSQIRWVAFLDLFLIAFCLRASKERKELAYRAAALEASEQRFRALAEAAPDVIFTLNQQSNIIFINAAAEKLLGYKPEELLGQPLTRLLPDDYGPEYWQGMNSSPATEQRQQNWNGIEIPVRQATGKMLPMEASLSHIRINDKIFLAGILRDISAHKESLELLRQSEHYAALRAEINAALAAPDVMLIDILRQVAEAIVDQLNAAVVRIWTLNNALATTPSEWRAALELQANVHDLMSLNGYAAAESMGEAVIKRIIKERQPYPLTEQQYEGEVGASAPPVDLMSTAGFPLLIENRLVGVLAIFSCTPMAPDAFATLSLIAEVLAQRIERQRVEAALLQATAELEVRVQERTASLAIANKTLRTEINERTRAEQELTEAQKLLHSIINGVPNPIFVKTDKGKYYLVNEALARLYGCSPADLIGKGTTDFHLNEEAEKHNQDDQEVLTSRQEKVLWENKFTDSQGNVHWFQTVKRPLILGADQPCLVLGISTDLTERKALESQMRQGQKLESIGQLAAGIAHEINTPMQFVGDNTRFVRDAFHDLEGVRGKLNELLKAAQADAITPALIAEVEKEIVHADVAYLCEEIPKAIQQALDGIARVSTIVQSMKDFSHPGSSEKIASDLNKAINSTITVTRNEWKYVADLETNFDENLPLVSCHLGEVSQVILNMLVNAGHAISDVTKDGTLGKGKITIITRAIGNQWAEIRISDTGTGIPPHVRGRIFDPFFTTKEVGIGTGQGLAISHAVIVDKHQGQLSFETEMGQGTTFIIRLPLKAQARQGQQAGQSA